MVIPSRPRNFNNVVEYDEFVTCAARGDMARRLKKKLWQPMVYHSSGPNGLVVRIWLSMFAVIVSSHVSWSRMSYYYDLTRMCSKWQCVIFQGSHPY